MLLDFINLAIGLRENRTGKGWAITTESERTRNWKGKWKREGTDDNKAEGK